MGNIIEFVGSNVMKDIDPCPARNCVYTSTSGQNGLLAYCGAAFAPNLGTKGSILTLGGGDADYWGNEVYAFDLATNVWTRLTNPSTALTGQAYPGDTTFDPVHGEYADGTPGAAHTYNVLVVIPGGTGGKGILLWLIGLYVYGRGTLSGWTHALDLGAGTWTRYSTNAVSFSLSSSVSCYDATTNKVWLLPSGGYHNNLDCFDLGTKAHTNVTLGNPGGFIVGYNPCAAQFPVGGLLLFATGIGNYGSPLAFSLRAVNLANTAGGVITLTLTGDMPLAAAYSCFGFDWDFDANVGYVVHGNTTADAGELAVVYKVTPPTGPLLTGTWTLAKITLPQALLPNASDGIYSRWRYAGTLQKFVMISKNTDPVTLWTPDGGTNPPPTNPTITNFSATPATINAGQSATLNATVTNATALTVDGAAATLPMTVTPSATHSYALVATGAAGTTPANASATVTVSGSTDPCQACNASLAAANAKIAQAIAILQS
jgi:hypothetical protein